MGAAGTGAYGRPPDAYGGPLRGTERWAVATGIHASRASPHEEARPHKRNLRGRAPQKVA
ncbi:hypothetical protein GCM10011428_43580 [Streptomyces violaceus]